MKKLFTRMLSFTLVFQTVFFSAAVITKAVDASVYNGHKYQAFDIPMSWQDAKAYCESLGGYLAVITSSDEENYVTQLVKEGGKKSYWIGLTDEKNEGVWEWVNGEKYEYSSWAPGQPDNETTESNEDFVELSNTSVTNYKWLWNDNINKPTSYTTDGHRFDQHGFVCEWGADSADTKANSSEEQKDILSLLEKSIILSINSPSCYLWGKQTYVDKDNMSVMPIVKNDRTLVPVRFVAESLGGTAQWDEATNTAIIKSGTNTIKIATDSDVMYVNDKAVSLDVPAQNINGRTLIPLRAISETLDKQVTYYKGFIIVSDSNIILDTTDSKIQNMIEYIRYSMLVYGSQYSDKKISFMNKSVGENNYYAINSDEIPFHTDKNKLSCATSGMFIENVACTEKDSDNYQLSMDVYNTMYSYGAIEVYNADGEWIKTIKIERYEGSPTSIKDTVTSAWDATYGVGWAIGNAAMGDNSDLLYRNSTVSGCTKVDTSIPKGSYIYITNSITNSQYVLMYDIISTAVDSVSLGSDWIDTFSESEKKTFLNAVKDKIMDKVSDKIWEGSITNTEFANAVAMDYSITSISDYVASVSQKALTVLNGLDIDVADILKKSAFDMGKDVAIGTSESLFKKATAFIGTALDVCFNIGKTTNFGCFISDIRKTMNSDSLLLVVGKENVNHEPSAVNFSIMQAYRGKIYTLHDFNGGNSLPEGINKYIAENKQNLVQSKYNVTVKNFAVYLDRIYYIAAEEGTDLLKAALCSCDLNGNDNKLLADNLVNTSLARIENNKLYYEAYYLSLDNSSNGSSFITDYKAIGTTAVNLSDLSESNTNDDLKKYFYTTKTNKLPFNNGEKDYYGEQKTVYFRDLVMGNTVSIGTFDLPIVYDIQVLAAIDNYVYCKIVTDTRDMSKGMFNTRLYRMDISTGKYEYLTSWFTS